MKTLNKQIPPERKAIYYVGMALFVIGILLFLSTFFTFMMNFGNFENFADNARSDGIRAFGGMFLMIVGGIIMGIGARGLAGSGIILDPEKARADVEPWSRLGGGVVQDALSEVGIAKKLEDRLDAPQQVKIRCRKCQMLNDDTAKFCNQCGSAI